ncbi:MAG: pilus assembly protein PilP [Thermodesulfobacteriota bacterium]
MRKILILFIFLYLATGGCGEKTPEHLSIQKLPPLPQPVKIRPQGPSLSPVTVHPEKPEQSEPPYNPTGKPDPFQPSRISIEAKGGGLPLEQFEVSDFELVGIVSGPGIKKAMVQDPTGKGFLVLEGIRIGKNGGKVTRIADKELIVEEPYRNFLGRKSFRKIALKIQQSR